MNATGRSTAAVALALLAAGCSTSYLLPGHDDDAARSSDAGPPVALAVGERVEAIEQGSRAPAPGGYCSGLVAEDPRIVAVEYQDGDPLGDVAIVGRSPGTTTLHYVNSFVYGPDEQGQPPDEERVDRIREASEGRFQVTVTGP